MDAKIREIEFVTSTFSKIKRIEQIKLKKALALRATMIQKLELNEEFDSYRLDFIRNSVDKLFTFMEELGKEFNSAHPDDKFTNHDIGDILATAIEALNNSFNPHQD